MVYSGVMQSVDAKKTLLGLLRETGQKPDALELLSTWRVFGQFMHLPLNDVDEDGMLYQYLTWSSTEPSRFLLSFCRQFMVLSADDVASTGSSTASFRMT